MELLLTRIDGEDELPDRLLILDSETTAIPIGRASKTEQKQLVPAVSNGWIRNPVISRIHAELTVDLGGMAPVVYIQDKKSSHGTFVNGLNILENKHALRTGDKLRFGSEVMRGEETFRPPVFDLLISPVQHLAKTVTPEETKGMTIVVPEDSGAESEGEMQGSQVHHPWTIDEPEMVPESELVRAPTADIEDDDASSESNLSNNEDEEDVEDEENEAIDINDEDEEPLGMSSEEESESEDHDNEDIPQSPVYTPQSPKYVSGEGDTFSSARYTPPQYGNDSAYLDGPFAYNWPRSNGGLFPNPHHQWAMDVSQQSTRTPAKSFTSFSQQMDSNVPQHSPFAPVPCSGPTIASVVTTSTRDILDQQTRRVHSKTDMSIRNLINPPPSTTCTKRKADELETEDNTTRSLETTFPDLPAFVSSSPVAPSQEMKLPQTPDSLSKELIEVHASVPTESMTIPTTTRIAAEPPRKKLRTMMAKAAIFSAGVMVGSAGMLGGLMSLPDGFFQ